MAFVKKQKGQIFSLDFVIAMTIAVAAIALLLHYYELSVYENTEKTLQDELTLIATNASQILLETNKCTLATNFKNQGYTFEGCSKTDKYNDITKKELMIPENYNCYITSGVIGSAGTRITQPEPNGCSANESPSTVKDVVVIERTYSSINSQITKSMWDDCITTGSCSLLQRFLRVKIWK